MMPDIVIRGMDMPKTCCECDLKFYDPEKRWDENGIEQIGTWVCKRTREIIWNTKRGSNCPIGSLPKGHGRLGDLDALLSVLDILKDKGCHGPVWDQMRDIVENMVIIVPAEGGTDKCSEN